MYFYNFLKLLKKFIDFKNNLFLNLYINNNFIIFQSKSLLNLLNVIQRFQRIFHLRFTWPIIPVILNLLRVSVCFMLSRFILHSLAKCV